MTDIDFCSAPSNPLEMSFLIPYYRAEPIYGELCNLCSPGQQISMLHPDILALLYHFGRHGQGDMLEFGAFVGGSTVAIAWGMALREPQRSVVSVELGGAYPHPTLGTDDIVTDLRKNLERYGVAKQVNLIIGNSRDPEVVRRVASLTGDIGYGTLILDTDGRVTEDFVLYRPMLRKGAYILADDYYSLGALQKVAPTREGIRRLVADGVVEPLGVYGWGTWVGRLKR